MKKRFTDEQIIGFLKKAQAGIPVACKVGNGVHWML
jgi:hypothetical protein